MRYVFPFLMMAIFLSPSHCVAAALDHSSWSSLLTRYVDDDGRVAYRDLQARDKAAFDRYLATLAQAQTVGMTEAEEKAFWMNAYNAVIISGILQGYTAESLLARKRLFSWFTVRVAGQERTPDEIEHQILRKKFHDPRIHFTIVCASSSCPKLRREAYVAERLEVQLNEAAQVFVNDPLRNRIETQGFTLSRIFEWFAEDFKKSDGSVVAFVRRFVVAEKAAGLNISDSELHYLEYDWTLNAQEGQRVS
jgi:hypothetical protein